MTTQIEYAVQGLYTARIGWEDVCIEDTAAEARSRLREYRENEPQYRHRITKRRVQAEGSA